jgi:BA14K-like protein
MSRFKVVGAAAILSMMVATPVFAQAAIQEPGAFAFYHPNADVLNGGRPTPAAGLGAMTSVPYESIDAYAAMDKGTSGASCAQRYRSYDPGSGSFVGYDGRLHPCE